MFFGLFWPSLVLLFQVNTVSTKSKLSVSQELSLDNSHISVFLTALGASSLLVYFLDFVLSSLSLDWALGGRGNVILVLYSPVPYADKSMFWTNGCPQSFVTSLRKLPLFSYVTMYSSLRPLAFIQQVTY